MTDSANPIRVTLAEFERLRGAIRLKAELEAQTLDAADAEVIISFLQGPLVYSDNRLEWLLRVTDGSPAKVFWQAFQSIWNMCDDTWFRKSKVLHRLRQHQRNAPGSESLQGADLDFWNNLPDPVRVYRGCSAARVRGISWTTDREVALGFARGHRRITVHDPVVASAQIAKRAIFLVSTDRKESEVILDPRHLAQRGNTTL